MFGEFGNLHTCFDTIGLKVAANCLSLLELPCRLWIYRWWVLEVSKHCHLLGVSLFYEFSMSWNCLVFAVHFSVASDSQILVLSVKKYGWWGIYWWGSKFNSCISF